MNERAETLRREIDMQDQNFAREIQTALDKDFPGSGLKHQSPPAPKPGGAQPSTASQVLEQMRATVNAEFDAIQAAIQRLKDRL